MDSIKWSVEESPEDLIALNEIFLNADTTMDFVDVYWIYYGSAFLESYSPYGEKVERFVINELWEAGNHEELIEISKSSFIENPGSVRCLLDIGYSYDALGDTLNAKRYWDKYTELLSVPFYSGTGESIDSAMIVRSVDDEYLIINELGYSSTSQALIFEDGIPFDVLETENEAGEKKSFYFNIYQPYILGLRKMMSLDEEEEKSNKKKKRKRKKKKSKKEK